MNFKQSFKLAIKSLRSSKMRAFLTMLGIIIGVASVIVLVSLMNGLSNDMTARFENMGTNTITINIMGRGGNRALAIEDVEDLVTDNPDQFDKYSPLVNASITAKYETNSVDTTAKGVNEYYEEMQNVQLAQGRFIQYIDSARRQKVCVIGTYLVEELFEGKNPVGESVKINGSSYKIVGVLEETADSAESSDDDIVYVPYPTATRLAGTASISTYYISAVSTDHIEETMAIIENKLYSIFGSENAYRVSSMSAMIEQINEMTGSIALVLVGIAGISLVVGGIGIMNIMLVSVTERTREIGIRKSLGAKRKDIMRQFIIEAATTSSVGGVFGILFGIAMAYLAGSLMDMSVAPSVNAVVIAFSVSVAIGMIFGYFPANKAAKMNPIDALRYD
ncbi:ABC transporter permease [Sinanaerobacter chloroacetimidivorans]|uniref:ABC transporter permease n=1 Tax=Sinanaerobacter chloroacetimidivorans TaxID=2818044 RepID=A0A8J8B1Z0_9FIRM|nr:ABC transporter permease [Sinanaerobacter chloroacetimidivorans]MBR0599213.1 ABC transporter permease [Sinanaerobacter chloroacetimidivorans]